jgi:RNA polymerase sigma-70 factor (ECF subfamily)
MNGEEFLQRVEAMTGTLYRVGYAMLSRPSDREDAVQEALRRAWENRGRLKDERYFETWLTRILINVCRDTYKRKRREIAVEKLPERTAPPGADPELHDAILRLPEALRLPLVLHYTEGYEVAEIAGMLRLPAGTVKTRMRKARALLKDTLSGEVGPR